MSAAGGELVVALLVVFKKRSRERTVRDGVCKSTSVLTELYLDGHKFSQFGISVSHGWMAGRTIWFAQHSKQTSMQLPIGCRSSIPIIIINIRPNLDDQHGPG